jgi:spore maturation protein A
MLMSCIWTGLIIISVLYGAAAGNATAVGNAAMEGAAGAVGLVFSMGGAVCLWCGVQEVMEQSGISAALSRALRPVLGRLFPSAAEHGDIMDALSSNVGANLLGLGNAATPMGVRAACGMAKLSGSEASDELCLLVVINTASIQILPTTVAAIRASAGAASPFDILPAVWISSAISVAAGLSAAYVFSRAFR